MVTKLTNSDENGKNQAEKKESNSLTVNDLNKDFDKINSSVGLFKIQTANDWINEARTKPPQKMLFDVFWFENEICILFADTNLGKSIKAVQIGESIARGEPIDGFRIGTDPQTVLYFDFELTDRQFRNRYTSESEPITEYQFSDNFIRAEINIDVDIPTIYNDFETYLSHSLELAIERYKSKVLIIDNLTYLRTSNEKAGDALPLMKHLKMLKSKYDLSILALAHTPKRELSKPLNRNDLQGSKMLINFCDSSFAIGESYSDKSLRYLKQIKVRNSECVYDGDNVAVCEIRKNDNFLGFNLIKFDREREHLKELTNEELGDLESKILELKEKGNSNYAIAKELSINEMKVGRVIKKHTSKNS